MLRWTDLCAERERCKDLQREAEIERLIRQVRVSHVKRASLYCRALTWLGHQLVTWGYRLQERDDTATTAPGLGMPHRAS
jgi:hypothetical protein